MKVSRGVATYSYEVGSETTTKTSSSGNAESSNGGHEYFAGSGLTLSNYTFSADVDKAALKAVETKADKAAKAAGDLAKDSVGEVVAAYPVTAARDGRRVTVGVACCTQADANSWFS